MASAESAHIRHRGTRIKGGNTSARRLWSQRDPLPRWSESWPMRALPTFSFELAPGRVPPGAVPRPIEPNRPAKGRWSSHACQMTGRGGRYISITMHAVPRLSALLVPASRGGQEIARADPVYASHPRIQGWVAGMAVGRGRLHRPAARAGAARPAGLAIGSSSSQDALRPGCGSSIGARRSRRGLLSRLELPPRGSRRYSPVTQHSDPLTLHVHRLELERRRHHHEIGPGTRGDTTAVEESEVVRREGRHAPSGILQG